MSFVVYWIREASHTDIMSQGYIGVSGNVQKRFAAHQNMENGTNAHLRHAIKKHGWDNMVKSVLLMADKDYCLDIERKLRPTDKIGWNLTVGGGYPPVLSGPQPHRKGRVAWNAGKTGVYSQEALAKMREKRLGVSPANKGTKLSEDRIEAMRGMNVGNTYRLGKKMAPEVIERISAKNRGRVQSAEERAMRSEVMTGIKKSVPRTDEHKRKLGANSKGKCWYNDGIKNVFCHAENKPDGFVNGRIAPWLGKKEK